MEDPPSDDTPFPLNDIIPEEGSLPVPQNTCPTHSSLEDPLCDAIAEVYGPPTKKQ